MLKTQNDFNRWQIAIDFKLLGVFCLLAFGINFNNIFTPNKLISIIFCVLWITTAFILLYKSYKIEQTKK